MSAGTGYSSEFTYCVRIGWIGNYIGSQIIVSSAYKNGTNDRKPASHHGRVWGQDGCLVSRNEGMAKRNNGLAGVMKACQATKKPTSLEMESVAMHEVPKEEASVETVRALRKH
jgi:hypothetical protein